MLVAHMYANFRAFSFHYSKFTPINPQDLFIAVYFVALKFLVSQF